MRPWCARRRPSSRSRRRSRLARDPLVRPWWLSCMVLMHVGVNRHQIIMLVVINLNSEPKKMSSGWNASFCIRRFPRYDCGARLWSQIAVLTMGLVDTNRTVDFLHARRPSGEATGPSTGGAGGTTGQPAAVYHRSAGRPKLHTQGDPRKPRVAPMVDMCKSLQNVMASWVGTRGCTLFATGTAG